MAIEDAGDGTLELTEPGATKRIVVAPASNVARADVYLPSANNGDEFTLMNLSTIGMRVFLVDQTSQIAKDGNVQTTGATGYIDTTDVGASVTLVYVSAPSAPNWWVAEAVTGTWTWV